MVHARLSDNLKCKARNLLVEFQEKLDVRIGRAQREFTSWDIVQAKSGPTFEVNGDKAVIVIGPNATLYEPTFVANMAHESAHLHLTDGEEGNASGLEEGFAVHFELAEIEKGYGVKERLHHIHHLPKTYAIALSDYRHLLKLSDNPAMRVREAHGKLTGVSSGQLRRVFPKLGRLMSYRLARRREMRPRNIR